MDTIENDILRRLAKKGRGRIFFAQEFYDLWPDSTVRYSLSNLTQEGQIARLARGVFCYPRLSEHGMKMQCALPWRPRIIPWYPSTAESLRFVRTLRQKICYTVQQ